MMCTPLLVFISSHCHGVHIIGLFVNVSVIYFENMGFFDTLDGDRAAFETEKTETKAALDGDRARTPFTFSSVFSFVISSYPDLNYLCIFTFPGQLHITCFHTFMWPNETS